MDYTIQKHDADKVLVKTITLKGLETFTTKGGNVKIAANEGNIQQLVGCLEPDSRLVHTVFNTSLPVVLRRLPDGWKGTLKEAVSEVNAGSPPKNPEIDRLSEIIENIEEGFVPKNKMGKYLSKKGYDGWNLEDLKDHLAELKGETTKTDEGSTE